MTATTGDGSCSHGNSSPRAPPAQQGKSCRAGVSALRWGLEGKSKQTACGTIHPPKVTDHMRAKTVPWISCHVRGAHGSSENEREDPKFVY